MIDYLVDGFSGKSSNAAIDRGCHQGGSLPMNNYSNMSGERCLEAPKAFNRDSRLMISECPETELRMLFFNNVHGSSEAIALDQAGLADFSPPCLALTEDT